MSSKSPAKSPSTSPANAAGGWIVFGLLLTIYWVLYFSADPERLAIFNLLLLPDEIFHVWTSGRSLHILDRVVPTCIALSWILASWGAGVLLMRLFARVGGEVDLEPLEQRAFETVAGLAATSHLILALGLAGMLNSATVGGAVVALIVAGCAVHRSSPKARPSQAPDPTTDPGNDSANDLFWKRWVVGLATPMIILLWLAACMPPWEFDVRAYHLQMPKEWHEAGQITFLAHNVYGNMPLGAEMHALATMFLTPSDPSWFYGAIAGKIVIASYVLLTAAGIWLAGRRWLSPTAGRLAALIFLIIPWVFQNGTIGHNEMALACYGFYAWFAALVWTRRQSASDAAPRTVTPVLLAGWLAGAAAACKYTAVIFIAAPLWMVVFAWHGKLRWREVLLMTLSGLAAGGLWYAKNIAFTGNPVYPLAYSVFGGEGWSESQAERWRSAHYAEDHHLNQLMDSVTRLAWRAGGHGAVLTPLAMFALSPWGWPTKARRLRWWLVGMLMFSFVVWWVVTHRLERFLLPCLPWVALLAGGAAAQLDASGWRRRCLAGLMVFAWLTALLPATIVGDARYLTSLEELRTDFDLKRIDPTHLLINTTNLIPVGKRLLMVGDAQPFDLETPVVYNSCWDPSPLTGLVRGKSAAERREALRGADISHVFVHWGELARYRQPGNYGYDPYITPELFDELVRQNVLREVPLPPEHAQTISTLFKVSN